MSERGIKSFISVCFGAIFLYFFIGVNVDFKSAWFVVSNLTHFVPFILTGIVCIALGLNERKFGSGIFAIISIVLLGVSL